ncbi:20226_t:CDS:1 [Racocetra persica]|uniref:20226_t:CDS:1 n=1 Tax=Racocetra persica TaxID=160502 RepID=A0ACA9M0T1_9GLOM|nr:20226_t:CDS:1 [Racocetra persica]
MQGNEQHIKPRPPSKEDAESLTEITVVIDENEVLALKLNTKNKLYKIREKLVKYEEKEMTNNVNFTKNGVIISINDEKKFKLEEILVENKVYLKKKPSWHDLVKKFKLEYGRNYEENKDKVVKKKAVIIEDCEFDVFTTDEYYYDDVTISSTDELIQNKSLFLKAQIEIPSTTKLGLSIESAKNSQGHSETALKFYAKNFGKAKISFQKQNVVLTQEFQNEVQKAIDSRDQKQKINSINKIIAEFGQFIPTTIQFGGRLYYEDTTNTTKNSANNNIESSVNLSIYGQGLEFQHKSGISNKNESTMQHKGSFIFGGDKIKIYEGKEAEWVSSLQDFRYWEPIEFQEPVSIFEFLDDDLKKKIKKIIGKRIIYSKVQDYSYKINNLNNHIVNLEMPDNVQTIFSDSEIDSQVFATILNMDENNDIFTYTLYTPKDSNVPKLIINCISNNGQPRKCHIKIGWIVVGYDPNIKSDLLNPDFHLQSIQSTKKKPAPSNNKHAFKMTEDNPLVACGIPVVSEVRLGRERLVIGYHFSFCEAAEKTYTCLYGYDLYEKKFSNFPNTNIEFNVLSFIEHPGSNILDHFREVDRKKKNQGYKIPVPFMEKNKKHATDNKLPEFVSLYVNKVGQCQQCIPEFIAKKLEHFILEQPECKNAIKENRFATVFNPEAAKK